MRLMFFSSSLIGDAAFDAAPNVTTPTKKPSVNLPGGPQNLRVASCFPSKKFLCTPDFHRRLLITQSSLHSHFPGLFRGILVLILAPFFA